MKCDFCQKTIKTNINFANIFSKTENICQECKDHFNIHVNKINNYNHYYFTNYENIKEIIYAIKYFGDTEQAKKFKILFKKFFKHHDFDMVTIAPTNATREAIRGFNHIAIICNLCEIKYVEIFSEKYRQKQAKIHTKRNFHMVNILNNKKNILENKKSILLIDDIFTSGKTLLSLAKEIEKINPNINISFLTLAKSTT